FASNKAASPLNFEPVNALGVIPCPDIKTYNLLPTRGPFKSLEFFLEISLKSRNALTTSLSAGFASSNAPSLDVFKGWSEDKINFTLSVGTFPPSGDTIQL